MGVECSNSSRTMLYVGVILALIIILYMWWQSKSKHIERFDTYNSPKNNNLFDEYIKSNITNLQSSLPSIEIRVNQYILARDATNLNTYVTDLQKQTGNIATTIQQYVPSNMSPSQISTLNSHINQFNQIITTLSQMTKGYGLSVWTFVHSNPTNISPTTTTMKTIPTIQTIPTLIVDSYVQPSNNYSTLTIDAQPVNNYSPLVIPPYTSVQTYPTDLQIITLDV